MDWLATLWLTLAWLPLLFFWANCPCCGACPNCTATPNQFQVDLSGITNSGCTSCNEFDGTWILTRTGSNLTCYDVAGSYPDQCVWRSDYLTPCNICPNCESLCVVLYAHPTNGIAFTTEVEIWVRQNPGGNNGTGDWSRGQGSTTPNCAAFSSQSFTRLGNGVGHCSTLGSSCIASAL